MQTLLSMGMKLMAGPAIEELFIWLAETLAKSTKTTVDDELVAIIKKNLEK